MRARRPSVRRVTVLPPVFGPGDDEGRVAVAEPDVDRDDPAGQARMAGAEEDDLGSFGRLGADAVQLRRQLRLGRPEVEAGQRREGLAQLRFGVGRDERRQLVEDPLDLLLAATWASRQALPSSTATSGSMNSVWPLPDASWTMPLTFERASALTGTT